IAFGVLALVLVSFALDHLRERFYPALGPAALRGEDGFLGAANRRAAPTGEEAQAPGAVEETPAEAQEAERKAEMPKTAAPVASPAPSDKLGGRAGGPPPPASSVAPRRREATIVEIDRNAVVQTGPGIPRWTWLRVPMRWSGPVQQGQEVRLWLLSPFENVLL